MKTKLLLTVVFLLLAGSNAFAQAPGAKPGAQPGAGAQKTRIAIVDVLSFRQDVLELKAKYDKLQAEFAPKYRELESLQSKITAQQKVLEENRNLTPQQAQKLTDDIEQLKRDFTRTREDSQDLAQKRENEETGAIYEKLSKYLDQYCAKHGITSVFDARRLQETGIIVYVKLPEANITADFVKEYNRANPVQSAQSK